MWFSSFTCSSRRPLSPSTTPLRAARKRPRVRRLRGASGRRGPSAAARKGPLLRFALRPRPPRRGRARSSAAGSRAAFTRRTMVATTRRVRDEEDSGGALGEATTGQGSVALCVGSAASVTAVRDGPAADTAGDAGLRPALKRGAKYQHVGDAAGGCGADDPADSSLETERAEGPALRFAPEPIVHVLDAGGTSHRGQTTDWAARCACAPALARLLGILCFLSRHLT